MNELHFKPIKIADYIKVSKPMIDTVNDDFIRDLLTVKLEGFIYAHTQGTQTITVLSEKPTFLDWLLRRKRSFTLKVDCLEVFKNPQAVREGNIIMFKLDESE